VFVLFPPPPALPPPPKAAFEIRWLDNFTVELNAFASSAAEGRRIELYQWDFGDGSRATDHLYLMQHRYEQPGRYVITLTVQDDAGVAASTQRDIVVVPEGEVQYEEIANIDSQIKTQMVVAVRTQGQLERLWQEALGNRTPLPDVPRIDFDRNVVIAIFLGEKPNVGYSIRVDQLRAEKGWLKIWYTEVQAGDRCIVPPALSHILLLLQADRVDLPVTFVSRTEVVHCRP
jgi:PKD repeat protein